MLSKPEFLILTSLLKQPESTQREIAEAVGISLGAVNAAVKTLRENGCLDNYNVTEAGLKALEPYRVENAIIMAGAMPRKNASGLTPPSAATEEEYTTAAWTI